jgi:hypothetical protein
VWQQGLGRSASVLQSALHRSERDLQQLNALGAASGS